MFRARRSISTTVSPAPRHDDVRGALAWAACPVLEQLEGRCLFAGVLAALEAQLATAARRDEWLDESLTAPASSTSALSSSSSAPLSASALSTTPLGAATPHATPTIDTVNPANGATNVFRDASIRMTVNLPNLGAGVDSATLGNGVLIYQGTAANRVNSIRNTSGGGDVIVITPRTQLAPNTTYTVEITSGLKDTSGASFSPFITRFTTGTRTTQTATTVSFAKTALPNTTGEEWTAVTFGPDRRLYAATRTGKIYRYATNPDGTLQTPLVINSVRAANGAERLITGIEFDPGSTAAAPVLWVSHGQAVLENATNWTGKLSKLSGADLGTYRDVVTGLPRSVRDHLNNQIKFGPDDALYMIQGSMSAAGAPDSVWGNRSETALSGAVLRIDVDDIGSGTLNVKTAEGGTYNPNASGADVTVYASGIRNAYDMVWHRNGELYVPANGTAAGGNSPAGDGAPALSDVPSQPDYLLRIRSGKYYGHPNPTRGEFVMYGGNPTSGPDKDEVGVYPVGTDPDSNYVGSAYNFGLNYSPDGVIEYRGGEFGGTLDGKLMVVRFSAGDDIVLLGVDREGGVKSVEIGAPGLTNFNDPLDLVQDLGTGFVYVAEFGGKKITLLKANPTIAFNKIQLTFSDVRGGGVSAPQRMTWTNRSNANVTIPARGIRLLGQNSDQFQLLTDVSQAVTLAPGQSFTARVRMAAPATTSAGLKTALLRLTTTVPGMPPLDLPVRGFAVNSSAVGDEPSLAEIVQTFNYGVRVGDNNPTTPTLPDPPDSPNDEVEVSQLYKARPGSVTIEPMAAFTNSASPLAIKAGYYAPGNTRARSGLFTIDTANNGTISPVPGGVVRFDPGTAAFGLYSQFLAAGNFVFSQDQFNSFEPTTSRRDKVRFYPLRTTSGTVSKNAYIVAFEGQTGSGDYQDNVFVIRNVTTTPPAGSLSVTGVNLINAATDATVGALANGGTISLRSTPQFSLSAVTAGSPGSVRFAVDGTTVRTENFTPYTIAGENPSDSSDILPFSTAVGTHTLTVTPFTGANATGTAGQALTRTFTVTNPLFATQINFQPANAAVPPKYRVDSGQVYGTQAGGLVYGWNVDNTANSIDRNSTRSPDQQHDTWVALGDRTWNIRVPNGRYKVYLAVGDATRFDAVHGVSVEGVVAAQGTPTADNPWTEQRVTVNVTDRTITLRAAPGSSNNKLAFLHLWETVS